MQADVRPGTVLGGDFRIEREIGAGGFGTVYVATQLSTGRERALKVLHAHHETDPVSRRRFLEEARIGARIQSEHVVEVIASGFDEATRSPWLAMELLEGEDLHTRVANGGPLTLAAAREMFAQLRHALGAAHDQGIVHRDLKPENIFLCRPRRHDAAMMVKVLDFGIAKSIEDGRTAGTATAAIGSPLFMAPEQGTEGASIRPATDVWPLGLIAFFALTGMDYWKAAHGSRNLQAMFVEVLVEPIEPASVRAQRLGSRHRFPDGFDEWFNMCLDRDPKKRFRHARSCLTALDGIFVGRSHAPAAFDPTMAAQAQVPSRPAAPSEPIPYRQQPRPAATPPSSGTVASPASYPTDLVQPAPAERVGRGRGPALMVSALVVVGMFALGVTGWLAFGDRPVESTANHSETSEAPREGPPPPAPSPSPPRSPPGTGLSGVSEWDSWEPAAQASPSPGLRSNPYATDDTGWEVHSAIMNVPARQFRARRTSHRWSGGAPFELVVDGRSYGHAPVSVELAPGLHVVATLHDGGRSRYIVHYVSGRGGSSSSAAAIPEGSINRAPPGQGRFQLQTDLPLTVTVDGRPFEYGGTATLFLPPGMHRVVMRSSQNDSVETLDVRVVADHTTSVNRMRSFLMMQIGASPPTERD